MSRQASVARLVINGRHKSDIKSVRALLTQGLRRLPDEVVFFITPGGFLELPWHYSNDLVTGWQSSEPALAAVIPQAEAAVKRLMTDHLLRNATVKYITVGVDILTESRLKGPHAELVGTFSVRERRVISWTGKSYPLPMQERTLLQERHYDSHFVSLDGERVMILGCHDLNMFSPRSRANQSVGSERFRACQAVLTRARAFAPTVVLHHPHGTDSDNIWTLGWLGVRRELPSATTCASSIGYHNYHSPKRAPRAALGKVLQATRSHGASVIDVIVDA